MKCSFVELSTAGAPRCAEMRVERKASSNGRMLAGVTPVELSFSLLVTVSSVACICNTHICDHGNIILHAS